MTPIERENDYVLPYVVTNSDGSKRIELPDYPVIFFALGDAPGAIHTNDANALMVRTLEALGHPEAPYFREELGKDPDEICGSGELRTYHLYDQLEDVMREITPAGFQPVDGGYINDEGIWFGWEPTHAH